MHISTWCVSLVGQWLFYSFFLFIRMSVHLSCMSIDNRYCYFNSVVCFVYRFQRVLKNHNSIVLYVVELIINSCLHIFSLICPPLIFIGTCKQLKETTTATRYSTVTFHDQHCPRLKAVHAFTTMQGMTLNCFRSQTKQRKEMLTVNQPGKFWKTFCN